MGDEMNKVILISSDSYILLEQELDKIVKNDNKMLYNLNESSLDDVLEEASYFSLFDNLKVVIGMNANFFGKTKIKEDDTKKLLGYINNPNDNTLLIFATYEAVDKRKSIVKRIIQDNGFIELKAPKGYELFNDIKKKLSIYKVNDDVVRYLISASLNSYDLICKEIEKLSLKYNPRDSILLSDIKKVVPMNYSDNVFLFVDQVVRKDLTASMRCLDELVNLKVDPIQLLNVLVREYRLIYYYKLLEGNSTGYILTELGLLDWQLKKIVQEASLYHIDDVKDIIIKLSLMDYKIKSGKEDKRVSLEAFIVSVCE